MPLGPDNDPVLELVGHEEDGWIIWHDGSPPTPVPGGPHDKKPADIEEVNGDD